jgi:two-component system, chemotaxis family, chemotaxis protein CheY
VTELLPPKVLVVEDDDATRRALVLGLGEDAIVTGAVDVDQATRFAAIQRPDLIVLDLLLDPSHPDGIDGPEVLHRLRAKGIPVPPVIVVSARAGGAEVAKDIGAAAYYRKPIDIGALASRIRELTKAGAPSAPANAEGDAAAP